MRASLVAKKHKNNYNFWHQCKLPKYLRLIKLLTITMQTYIICVAGLSVRKENPGAYHRGFNLSTNAMVRICKLPVTKQEKTLR